MKQQSIRKNFVYSTFYQVLTLITPFITAPYLARVLGPEMQGIQSFVESNITYFALFATMGTTVYGAREISQARDDPARYSKLFWEIELVSVITGTCALAAWLVFAMTHPTYRPYYLVLALGLVATICDISWFFNGLEQIRSIVIRGTVIKITSVILTFIFVNDSGDLLLYMLITTVTGTIAIISYWFQMPRFLVKVERKSLNLLPHFKQTLIYFIPTIATSIYTVLDKTLLGVIIREGKEQNGYYAQAEKIINIAKSMTYVSVNSVVGIRASYLFGEERYDEVKERIKTSMHVIMMIGLGCVFGIIGIAENLVPVFLGEQYLPVTPILIMFAPVIIIIGVSNCLETHYYIPSGRRTKSLKFLIVGAAANLVMNLILIPRFGAFGAVVATVAAELLITIMFFAFCDGYLTLRVLFACGWKKIIAGAVMCAVVYGLGKLTFLWGPIHLALQVILGAAVYLVMLLLLRDDFVKRTVSEYLGRILHRRKAAPPEEETAGEIAEETAGEIAEAAMEEIAEAASEMPEETAGPMTEEIPGP
ncbi:MAG: flippase [Lachnospiraceae bacterium]|nr:flippase [Lachnospiraceae bacterium]